MNSCHSYGIVSLEGCLRVGYQWGKRKGDTSGICGRVRRWSGHIRQMRHHLGLGGGRYLGQARQPCLWRTKIAQDTKLFAFGNMRTWCRSNVISCRVKAGANFKRMEKWNGFTHSFPAEWALRRDQLESKLPSPKGKSWWQRSPNRVFQ